MFLTQLDFEMATKAQTPVVCELCDADTNVNFYCITCGQVLCLRCKQIHSRSTHTKKDEVISLSEARLQKKCKPTVTLCIDHRTEEISLFCERCNQFICGECMDDKHQEHKIMTLKKMKTKQDKLVQFMEDLKNKKKILTKALNNENKVHTQNAKCFDQIRTEISDQFNKIVEEFTLIRDEKFTELSVLSEKENKRHSNVVASMQSNTQMLTSAIELIQAGIDSGNPITMETTENNVRQSVQNVDVPPEPIKAATKYKPGNLKCPVMLPLFGDMSTEDQGGRPKQQQPVKVIKPQHSDVIQRKIDLNKVNTKTVVKARNTGFPINVIVPVTQDTAWVAAAWDKQLTMINIDGATVRTSVQVYDGISYIIDAKQYNNDLLVTCWEQHQVIRLSEDGGTKTTFSDVSPYYTYGLCVTHLMDVLLCLKSTFNRNDQNVKVIRLNSKGETIQSIQHDDKGHVMYSCPRSVTSLQSGEVIVCDRDQHMRVSCVKSEDHLMFTWKEEVQGTKVDKFDPHCITHDKYNNLFITDCDNHRVCVLNKAKCLIDSTQGIVYPLGIAVDDVGLLWIGCGDGEIHIIEY